MATLSGSSFSSLGAKAGTACWMRDLHADSEWRRSLVAGVAGELEWKPDAPRSSNAPMTAALIRWSQQQRSGVLRA